MEKYKKFDSRNILFDREHFMTLEILIFKKIQ